MVLGVTSRAPTLSTWVPLQSAWWQTHACCGKGAALGRLVHSGLGLAMSDPGVPGLAPRPTLVYRPVLSPVRSRSWWTVARQQLGSWHVAMHISESILTYKVDFLLSDAATCQLPSSTRQTRQTSFPSTGPPAIPRQYPKPPAARSNATSRICAWVTGVS
ncbi:hypothetical protein F5B21DRAFT_439266 [Xylaria acuta]|nr:hypothetical protein F5B21DRAFT_439266 [Xylaria acuta]